MCLQLFDRLIKWNTYRQLDCSIISGSTSSSLSSIVFFKKVGCNDSPLLSIFSRSRKVFVFLSRPYFGILYPLSSPISSNYFPVQCPIATSGCYCTWSCDQSTPVFVSLLLKLCYVCHLKHFVVSLSFQDIFIIFRYDDISNDCNFAIYFWWLLSMFHIHEERLTTHTCMFW